MLHLELLVAILGFPNQQQLPTGKQPCFTGHHVGWPVEYGEPPHWVSLFTLKCWTWVTSQDKAPSVISRVLKKNNRDSAVASEYELVQLLPGERELTIPPSANVFYAMDGASHDFLLRQRRRPSAATLGLTSSPSASGTPPSEGRGGSFPRIKAKGRKIARALF
uniref:Ral guanine nucleotide dissociation stimulator like 2 n=1 Tax=Equus caballus TaxID=9796 RepID=A0A9L0SL49_HORSE